MGQSHLCRLAIQDCSNARHDADRPDQDGPGPHTLIPSFTLLACQCKYGKQSLDEHHHENECDEADGRAYLSGVPASCATTCRPKSKGCRSSLVMGCTRRDPSGRMARKYSLSPTTSCSWLREALPTAFERAVKAKPCACAACWNACKSQTSVWVSARAARTDSCLQLTGQPLVDAVAANADSSNDHRMFCNNFLHCSWKY